MPQGKCWPACAWLAETVRQVPLAPCTEHSLKESFDVLRPALASNMASLNKGNTPAAFYRCQDFAGLSRSESKSTVACCSSRTHSLHIHRNARQTSTASACTRRRAQKNKQKSSYVFLVLCHSFWKSWPQPGFGPRPAMMGMRGQLGGSSQR